MFLESGEPIPKELQPPFISGKALEAWNFYAMVANQWHYASGGMGGVFKVGLNYQNIEVIARNRGVKLKGVLFSLLQIIEQKILAKEREADEQ